MSGAVLRVLYGAVSDSESTGRVIRQTIPADPAERRQWVEAFTDEIVNHPHDDFTTWVLREEDKRRASWPTEHNDV